MITKSNLSAVLLPPPPSQEEMFQISGIDKEEWENVFDEVIKTLPLPSPYCNEKNQIRQLAYYIAEFVFYYLAPKNSKLYYIRNKEIYSPIVSQGHFFVCWPNNMIVDLTLEDPTTINYDLSEPAKLHKPPSQRAKLIAKILGFDDE